MKNKSIPRRRRYPQLISEYEQYLEQRVRNDELREVTYKTYLNDAHKVLESLVAALSVDVIEALVKLRFQGDYGSVIKDLKAIVGRHP